jgi:hypothetical protein
MKQTKEGKDSPGDILAPNILFVTRDFGFVRTRLSPNDWYCSPMMALILISENKKECALTLATKQYFL